MTLNTLEKLKEFHDAFEVPTPEKPIVGELSKKTLKLLPIADGLGQFGDLLHAEAQNQGKNLLFLRLQLIQEELAELASAMANGDNVATLDALVDLRYVVDGSILALGFSEVFNDAFNEVHRANMSKLENGKPVKDAAGRVVKGKNYLPPNLKPFILS